MGRVTGRDAAATRRLVLDAAASQIAEHGVEASLDSIAERAGVSKGGLKYHFTSKDALLHGLAQDQLMQFRALVESHVDPQDSLPGALLRGYVHATISELSDAAGLLEKHALMAQLSTVAVVQEACAEDARWWDGALEADGCERITTALVVAAADGLAVAPLWGSTHSPQDLASIGERLVSLTRA